LDILCFNRLCRNFKLFLKNLPLTVFIFCLVDNYAWLSIWTCFTYKSATKENISVTAYLFWNYSAGFVFAFIAFLIFNPHPSNIFSLSMKAILSTALAGMFNLIGCLLLINLLNDKYNIQVQETIIGIIVNCELIPYFSFLILSCTNGLEGFIGSIIVLIGILMLNFAEKGHI